MKTEMNFLRRKLASRRGASITFAMLLFLICAVIGVIVLVAGTAAAGRTSRLVEADQRYFAVNSAAQLLREEIEGSSVTVSRTRTVNGRSGSYIRVSIDEKEVKNEVTNETEIIEEQHIVGPYPYVSWESPSYERDLLTDPTKPTLPFLKDAAYCFVFGDTETVISQAALADEVTAESLWLRKVSFNRDEPLPLLTENIRLQLKDDAGETALEPVNLDVTLERNGDLQVTVWQRDKDKNETYTVTMVFSANRADLYSNTDTDFQPNTVLSGGEEVTAIPVSDIGSKVDTFTWTLAELKKG